MSCSTSTGSCGERELAGFLRERGWRAAKRGQQRSGLEQADVVDGPAGVHFEVKRVEKLNVWAAYEQAQRDAELSEEPVVAMRRNRSPWLAVVDLGVFLALLRAADRDEVRRVLRSWEIDQLLS